MSAQSDLPNKNEFFVSLRSALKGDVKRARALHEVLWVTAIEARLPEAGDLDEGFRLARAQARRAQAIVDAAQVLLALLSSGDSLPADPSKLATAQWMLIDIVGEAHKVAAIARSRAKQPPGPKRNFTREWLSEYVVIQLVQADVSVKISKSGLFQRVLAAVQEAAGYRDRTPANVERDARRALAKGPSS